MIYFLFSVLTAIILIATGKKAEIKLKVVIPWTFLMIILGCVTLYFLDSVPKDLSIFFQLIIPFLQSIIISIIVLLILFFRDPKRIPPDKDNIILSPADGRIIYIKEIANGDFPFAIKGKKRIPLKEFTGEDFITGHGVQIGIAMNYTNVHINRVPIKGKVLQIKRVPGKFLSLKHLSSLLENERVFTLIGGRIIKIGVVQIASRLVRRIYSFVKEGDNVQMGQKMGVIRFGSQVDILIPFKKNVNILVKTQEEVKAGLTVIATY